MKGNKAVLTLSQRAVKQLQKLIQKEGHEYIRLDLRKRGCSGLSYTMNYTNTKKKFDELIQQNGINILISPNVLMQGIGTRMDYETNRMRSEFVFHNPNSKGECGCGESFAEMLGCDCFAHSLFAIKVLQIRSLFDYDRPLCVCVLLLSTKHTRALETPRVTSSQSTRPTRLMRRSSRHRRAMRRARGRAPRPPRRRHQRWKPSPAHRTLPS